MHILYTNAVVFLCVHHALEQIVLCAENFCVSVQSLSGTGAADTSTQTLVELPSQHACRVSGTMEHDYLSARSPMS